ncbi:MAG: GSU2403 family nucleotidyltransferase fold protein [Alphaproteobacteria bacterium]|nr:GSU2403 family nucleotidyltransferase fold protein [Alphaproteobacteria bacterium]
MHARSLRDLNDLKAEPVPAPVACRSGVLVQIPRPERFAIHKLIVANRHRKDPDGFKAAKDRLRRPEAASSGRSAGRTLMRNAA